MIASEQNELGKAEEEGTPKTTSEELGEPEASAATEDKPTEKDTETNRPPEDLSATLKHLEGRVEELQDQLLRRQAEVENIQKRASREAANARKFALEPFVTDLLPAIDSLIKARESLQDYQKQQADKPNLADGVALCLQQLTDAMKKNGVRQIDPLGEPFDPGFHEAVAMTANEQAEPNTVLEVYEVGYTLNDRLIRAARVVVSTLEQKN